MGKSNSVIGLCVALFFFTNGSGYSQTMEIDKSIYDKGEIIRITFTKTDSTPGKAWVGIIPSSVPHGSEAVNDENDIIYRFIEDHPDGKLSFRAPTSGQQWDIRYNSNDGANQEYSYITFSINTESDDVTIEEELKVWNVPAVGIGIIEGGRITETSVYGELTFGDIAPENTIFNVASLTKPIVANLTLQFVSNGTWLLDEPLSNYWVDPDLGEDPFLHKLTTRHVLSHQTGFPNWRREDKLSFSFEPGTAYQYSGEGFEYLREALEREFNSPIEDLAKSWIFEPFGMTETRFIWDERMDESRFAQWHDEGGYTYGVWRRDFANAADDLLTTVEDYSKFGIAVLKQERLSDEIFAEMIESQVQRTENKFFGLGWGIIRGLENDEYALYHGGSDRGVQTQIVLLPKSYRGLVVMTNGDNGQRIIEKVLKGQWGIGEEILEKMNQ